MPDWCSDYISISGPKEKIEQVWNTAHDCEGLLEAMVPLGEWDYQDAVTNWGTKWDINPIDSGLNYEEQGNGVAVIEGHCESAWSPPVKALETFLDKNPECEANLLYYEPSMDFCGNLDHHIQISTQHKDFWSTTDIGEELEEVFGISEMLEEFEEEEQEIALATPPDVIEEKDIL